MTIIADPVVRVLSVRNQNNYPVIFCEVADPEDEEFAAASQNDLIAVAIGTDWQYPSKDWSKDYQYNGVAITECDEWHVFTKSVPSIIHLNENID